jgi:hypothetical protein
MHISWRRRNSISRMLMEQHQLETKFSRSPQRRRLASDRKDRLRASLNAAKGRRRLAVGDPARDDVNGNDRKLATRRQRSRAQFAFFIFDELSVFNPGRPPSAFDQTKSAQNFQMRGKLNFQMRWKLHLEYGYLLNKISALALAGAGGIEPPNGGIKIRCLTAWLRPNCRSQTARRRAAPDTLASDGL